MTSFFQQSTSPSSVAIFQHYQWMEFTFHNSRVCAQYSDFLDRVQLRTQKLLKQGYVAPRLKSSHQKFYGRHHHWLTIGKYPYLKWQWIFYFLRMCVLSSITTKTFDQTWLYIRVTRRVSYKKQELFTHRERLSSPQVFFVGSVLFIFLVFVLSYYVSLCSEFRVMISVTICA